METVCEDYKKNGDDYDTNLDLPDYCESRSPSKNPTDDPTRSNTPSKSQTDSPNRSSIPSMFPSLSPVLEPSLPQSNKLKSSKLPVPNSPAAGIEKPSAGLLHTYSVLQWTLLLIIGLINV